MNPMREHAAWLRGFSQDALQRGWTCHTLAEFQSGPMTAWERPGTGPRIYLSAGIHGDEPAGPLALRQLLQIGCFTNKVHWLLCPSLNPDGLQAGTRGNSDGLDLNRDYLKTQSTEIRAHTGWLKSMPPPDLFLSLHEDCDTSGFYLYEINLGEDQPGRTRTILDAVRPCIPPEPGPIIDDHTTRDAGWIHHVPEADEPEGWPEAIFMAKHGCPLSYTFESPSRMPLETRTNALVIAVQSAVSAFLHSIDNDNRNVRLE